jgi:AraC-like DNA-binding protein
VKPAFESLIPSAQSSFHVRRFQEKQFSAPYHFHPEYELTLIVRGHGKRYVGANMSNYFPGDLVLLGSNLPHCWKTAPLIVAAGSSDSTSSEGSVSVVIQFREDFMGMGFFDRPEMASVARLLAASRRGIHFTGDTGPLEQQMHGLPAQDDPLQRLLQLLDLLQGLAAWPGQSFLDLSDSPSALSGPEKERMNLIMAYIVDNFQHEVSVKAAAAAVNLSYHAFCKYFKRANRKTFMETVTGYRIDMAMRQLIYTDKAISEIAFECGFNDISNFHKTFRARMCCSPLHYRKQFDAT